VAHNTPNPRSCLSAQTADLHLAVRRDTIARCISRPATTMQWRHHRWIDERWLQDVRRIGGSCAPPYAQQTAWKTLYSSLLTSPL